MRWIVLTALFAVSGCKAGSEPQTKTQTEPKAGAYRDEVLADKPLAYFEFNESGPAVADSMGRHNGTAKGGVTFGQKGATSALGKAVLLDGKDGRIQIPGHADFRSIGEGAFSIELWFCTSSGSRGDLINYKAEEGRNDLGVFSCLESEGQISEYEAQDHRVSGEGSINAWHHVVVTRDSAGAMTLYVDGQERDKGTGELSLDFDADLLIGCNHQEGDYDAITIPFSGLIAQAAIYKTALPAARVRAHYAAGGKAVEPVREKPKEETREKQGDDPRPKDEEGFVSLFNGVDFTGWKFWLGDANLDPARTYSVRDGMIVCTGQPNGYMYTKRTYRDFTLRLDWRFKRPEKLTNDRGYAGNSGYLIFIQNPGVGVLGVWPKCIEVQGMHRDIAQVLPVPRSVKCKIQDFKDARTQALKPVGEWHSLEIVSKGGTVTTYVNGLKVTIFSDCELKEGVIGLQSEGAEIHWRNVRLREEK